VLISEKLNCRISGPDRIGCGGKVRAISSIALELMSSLCSVSTENPNLDVDVVHQWYAIVPNQHASVGFLWSDISWTLHIPRTDSSRVEQIGDMLSKLRSEFLSSGDADVINVSLIDDGSQTVTQFQSIVSQRGHLPGPSDNSADQN
jgi:hypothetical protein